MSFETFVAIILGVILGNVIHAIFAIKRSLKNIEKKICECEFIMPVEKKYTRTQYETGIQLLKK